MCFYASIWTDKTLVLQSLLRSFITCSSPWLCSIEQYRVSRVCIQFLQFSILQLLVVISKLLLQILRFSNVWHISWPRRSFWKYSVFSAWMTWKTLLYVQIVDFEWSRRSLFQVLFWYDASNNKYKIVCMIKNFYASGKLVESCDTGSIPYVITVWNSLEEVAAS